MSGEQSTPEGPLTGKVLYAHETGQRFDVLADVVDAAGGRLTKELQPGLFAIVTDVVDDPELVEHALAHGCAVLTPDNAIAQIERQLDRVARRANANRDAPATASAGEAGRNTDDNDGRNDGDGRDDGDDTEPRPALYRQIDWEKLAAIGAVVIIVVFAIRVWNERAEERRIYEAEVRQGATQTRTDARCVTLASGEQGEVLVFNDLLAASSDRDGTFWSDVVDEMRVLCESS